MPYTDILWGLKFCKFASTYSISSLIRPLSPKAAPSIRSNFRFTEILKCKMYYYLFPSREATTLKQTLFHCRKSGLIRVGGGGVSWLSSYGSWIYNYLCNQCLLPLKFVTIIGMILVRI